MMTKASCTTWRHAIFKCLVVLAAFSAHSGVHAFPEEVFDSNYQYIQEGDINLGAILSIHRNNRAHDFRTSEDVVSTDKPQTKSGFSDDKPQTKSGFSNDKPQTKSGFSSHRSKAREDSKRKATQAANSNFLKDGMYVKTNDNREGIRPKKRNEVDKINRKKENGTEGVLQGTRMTSSEHDIQHTHHTDSPTQATTTSTTSTIATAPMTETTTQSAVIATATTTSTESDKRSEGSSVDVKCMPQITNNNCFQFGSSITTPKSKSKRNTNESSSSHLRLLNQTVFVKYKAAKNSKSSERNIISSTNNPSYNRTERTANTTQNIILSKQETTVSLLNKKRYALNNGSKKIYPYSTIQLASTASTTTTTTTTTTTSSSSSSSSSTRTRSNPEHLASNQYPTSICSQWIDNFQALENMVAIMFALDEINAKEDLLPDIKLGVTILDDCFSPTLALARALQFMPGASRLQQQQQLQPNLYRQQRQLRQQQQQQQNQAQLYEFQPQEFIQQQIKQLKSQQQHHHHHHHDDHHQHQQHQQQQQQSPQELKMYNRLNRRQQQLNQTPSQQKQQQQHHHHHHHSHHQHRQHHPHHQQHDNHQQQRGLHSNHTTHQQRDQNRLQNDSQGRQPKKSKKNECDKIVGTPTPHEGPSLSHLETLRCLQLLDRSNTEREEGATGETFDQRGGDDKSHTFDKLKSSPPSFPTRVKKFSPLDNETKNNTRTSSDVGQKPLVRHLVGGAKSGSFLGIGTHQFYWRHIERKGVNRKAFPMEGMENVFKTEINRHVEKRSTDRSEPINKTDTNTKPNPSYSTPTQSNMADGGKEKDISVDDVTRPDEHNTSQEHAHSVDDSFKELQPLQQHRRSISPPPPSPPETRSSSSSSSLLPSSSSLSTLLQSTRSPSSLSPVSLSPTSTPSTSPLLSSSSSPILPLPLSPLLSPSVSSIAASPSSPPLLPPPPSPPSSSPSSSSSSAAPPPAPLQAPINLTAVRSGETNEMLHDNAEAPKTASWIRELPTFYDVVGIIGAYTSSLSVVVADVMTIFNLPQISHASTTDILSDKTKYPSFFRTVPADQYQIQTMAELLRHFEWKYVSIVFSADAYGTQAEKNLRSLLHSFDICVAQSVELNDSMVPSDYDNVISALRYHRNARVVVLYADIKHIPPLMEAVKGQKAFQEFIWAGSDTTSLVSDMEEENCRYIIGSLSVAMTSAAPIKFRKYLYSFLLKNPKLLKQLQTKDFDRIYALFHEFSDVFPTKTVGEGYYKKPRYRYVPTFSVSYAIDAVYAYAHAIQRFLNVTCPGASGSEAKRCIQHRSILPFLKKVKFQGTSGVVSFNKYGDAIGRIAVNQCQMKDGMAKQVSIATWDIKERQALHFHASLQWPNNSVGVPRSLCADECTGNQIYVFPKQTCCWSCVSCKANEISILNKTHCSQCPDLQWPDEETFLTCRKIEPSYIHILDLLPLTLAAVTTLGLMFSFVTAFTFYSYRTDRIIRSTSRELSSIMLIGVFVAFLLVISLLSPPTTFKCYFNHVGFSLTFTLIYGPLLVKTNRIYRIFTTSRKSAALPKRTSSAWQLVFASGFILVQAVIVSMSTSLSRPGVKHSMPVKTERYVIRFCDVPPAGFLPALAFNLALVLTCTLYAFKTRRLPDNYNESRYIAFCVYTTVLVWVSFIPTYFAMNRPYYKVVILALALLVNSIVCLLFLFVPKLYALYISKHGALGQHGAEAGVEFHHMQLMSNFSMSGVIRSTPSVVNVDNDNSNEKCCSVVAKDDTVVKTTKIPIRTASGRKWRALAFDSSPEQNDGIQYVASAVPTTGSP